MRCDGKTGQTGNRDNPANVQGVTACFAVWDPVHGYHQGQQPLIRLHQQAGQKTAPDQRHVINFALAMREPSTEDIQMKCIQSM